MSVLFEIYRQHKIHFYQGNNFLQMASRRMARGTVVIDMFLKIEKNQFFLIYFFFQKMIYWMVEVFTNFRLSN